MLPRFLIPYVHLSDGHEVVRIKDLDLHHVRTAHDDQKWDFDMSSTRFRRTIKRMEREVKAGRRALKPDPRVLVQYWESLEAHRNEGPFRERWMYLNSFGEEWDLAAVDERVGDVVYHNHPFQMLFPGCGRQPCVGHKGGGR